jgi:hypothetical protein
LIESIKKIFSGLFIAFDSLEFAIAFIFATAIFFAVPIYLIKDLYQDGYLLLSFVISLTAISTFGICIRDLKNRKWSFLSIGVTFLWGICFLIVAWEMAS